MEIRKAFKFELMPNGAQARKMNPFCGCARFVFNKALDGQNQQYRADNDFKFNDAKVADQLPRWKAELPWLKDCHSQVLQQSLKNSFRFLQGFKLDETNSRIYLPKIGWLHYRKSRHVSGNLKNVTVSQKCGKWFVSVQIEQEAKAPKPNGGEVGIGRGIVRFATLNNGQYFEPLNSFKKQQNALRKAQQALSRKTKLGKNWLKSKRQVSKIHHRLANARKDYLHKISTEISQNYAIVYVEDLQVSHMSKSAKGNAEQHGRMVRQKLGLNRKILNQGWFEFRRQLDYKTAWNGGHLI